MNPPAKSKINWTGLIMAFVGLAIAFDLIPQEAQEPITQITLILGPALIMTFRTWFTEKKQ